MFVRFVTSLVDRKSHERLGIIRSASFLQGKNEFSKEDDENLEELYGWFNFHLRVPHRFSKAKKKRGTDVATRRAISWFKDSAGFHIRRAREMAVILERNGIVTEMLRTKTPGYVVYEDDYQVAAIPFS